MNQFKIVLLQNTFILDQIQRLNEFMHSGENRSKVTGSIVVWENPIF